MAVRVRLKIERGGKSIETSALVNTGFETEAPQLLLPEAAARVLGITLKETEEREYLSVGGITKLYLCKSPAKVRVTGKTEGKVVKAQIVVSPFEEEVLISDKLNEALGIVLENVAEGTWRLRGEREIHGSEQIQRW
jgi:predicted aspartyl protease